MEQTEEEPMEGILHVQILQQPGADVTGGGDGAVGATQSGETTTLSLENAAQLILQQHSLQGDEEGRLQPGTYQIITQPMGNSISMIQAPDGSDLSAFGLGGQGIILQAGDIDVDQDSTAILQAADTVTEDQTGFTVVSSTAEDQTRFIVPSSEAEDQTSFTVAASDLLNSTTLHHQPKEEIMQQGEELDGQSESVLQIDLPASQSESMLQVINHPLPVVTSEPSLETVTEGVLAEGDGTYSVSYIQQPDFPVKQETEEEEGEDSQDDLPFACKSEVQQDADELVENTTEASTEVQTTLADTEQEPSQTDQQADTTTTAATTTETNDTASKMPVVKVEKPIKKPDLSKPIAVTDHMEVVVGGKKCLLKVNPDTGQLCAYPLISASATGKKRGRPRKSEVSAKGDEDRKDFDGVWDEKGGILDHEQANSAAEGLLELSNTGPDGIRRSGRARRKAKTLDDYDMIEVSSDDEGAADEAEDEVLPSGAVRKRKPASRKEFLPASPVPTSGVKRGRGRPRRYPRPDEAATSSQIPAMIIPSGDGQTIMMAPIQGLTNLEAFQEQVKNLTLFQQDEATQYLNTAGTSVLSLDDGTQINIQMAPPSDQKLTTDDVESMEDKLTTVPDQDPDMDDSELGEGTSGMMQTTLSQAAAEAITLNSDPSLNKTSSSSDEGQATIIQIPENLLPMFMQKKDPVKLGLKASDSHLEKWRCERCDHQSYYEHQHQSHLATQHPGDTVRCKCCPYVTFDKTELLDHFKVTHPRCICSVCDHMAEHAYIIKRHMMRHTQDGCTCDLCGKVYKDQYVLKMHVKMVHLPAEVLFECTICTKKFTRKAHLKRHLRIHDPQKPFKCPHCQYRGCERSDISKHLLIHEDPKHTCDVCGKTFRHVKNKELHLKRHTGQRDYKCGVCDFYGYTFTDIRKHIERKHSDAKTYLCDKCGAAFKNEQLLRDHRTQQCEMFMIEQALSIATSDGGTSHATIQIPSSLSTLGGGDVATATPVGDTGVVASSATAQQLQIHGGQTIAIDNQGNITVEHVSLSGYPLTRKELTFETKKVLDLDGRKTPFKDNLPGKGWFKAFKARNPDLAERTPAALGYQRAGISLDMLKEDGIGLSEEQLQVGVSQGHITDSELQSVVSHTHQLADIGQGQGEIIQEIGAVDHTIGAVDQDIGSVDQNIGGVGQDIGQQYTGVVDDDVNLTEEEDEEEENMDDIEDMSDTMRGIDDDKQQLVNVGDEHMLGMVNIMR